MYTRERNLFCVHILISLDLLSVFTTLFMYLIKTEALEFSVKLKLLFIYLFSPWRFFYSLAPFFPLQISYGNLSSISWVWVSTLLFWYIANNVHDTKHLAQRSKMTLMESGRCHASHPWTRSGRSHYAPIRANEHRLSRLVLALALSDCLFTNSSSTTNQYSNFSESMFA